VQHKEIFQSVKNAGHLTGNHTFSHLHPLKAKNKILYDEVERTNKYTQTIYFRPPYGKLKLRQFLSLKKKYQIVLWDVLSYDWDTTLAPSECAQIAKKHIRKGSIIVFHDSPQAYPRMIYSLKSILKEYSDKGYSFITLENVYS
jgi:peptidoglycan/xylan/chitin deacetylase (PgdA/CDA1 family)